jgi:hypothetical protein
MGAYDDLIPQGGASGGAQTAAPTGGGAYDDLVPTAESQRADRLRKISRAGMSAKPGAWDMYGDSFTLGLQKPVAGVVGGINNLLRGDENATFGEGYTAGTGAYDEWLNDASKNSGWGGTAASVAGSLASGMPGRAAATGLVPMLRNAFGFGAVEGAARNADSVEDAVKGAAVGGTTAAGTAFAANKIMGMGPGARRARAAEREAARGVPTQQLRDEARQIYRALDQSGTAYDLAQTTNLADTIRGDLVNNGWDPQGVHSTLNGVIGRIEDLRNNPASLETLQQIREQLASNATSIEPQVRRIAGRIMRNIDGFVGNEVPAMSNLPADQIGPMWQQARQRWRAANTAEDIGWRLNKAERRASSTNSGQNTENAIRQNIRSALDKAEQPTRYNPYTPAETAQMERIVNGGPVQNSLRYAGNVVAGIPGSVAGMGGGASLGLGGLVDPAIAAGVAVGAPFAMTGAGHLLKRQAAEMAQDEADTLIRMITTGSPMRLPPMSGPPTRENLARLMRQQQIPIGFGRAAAGATGGQ